MLLIWLLFFDLNFAYASDLNSFVRVRLENNTIQKVAFEDYVAAVVTHEMPSRWPEEALKAQAVAVRSFTLVRRRENQNKDYDVVTTTLDQVYKPRISKQAWKAVQDTRGLILKDEQGNIVKAFYHSDCGGETVSAGQVWLGEKSVGIAKDPYCQGRQTNQWAYKIPAENFFNALKITAGSIRLLGQSIQIDGSQVSVQNLRQKLGFDRLKGTPQAVEQDEKSIVLYGKGWGHRVGLCQFGARDWALKGRNDEWILSHYYPKSTLSYQQQTLSQK